MSQKKSLHRINLLGDRAGWRCTYCGCEVDHKSMVFDHIIPKSRGGRNGVENLTASCSTCNGYKWDYPLDEFFRRALRKRDKALQEAAYWDSVSKGAGKLLSDRGEGF